MKGSFVKTFIEFKSSLKIESIQMAFTKFDPIIANFSYFLVDQENHFDRDIDQLKNQVQVIIIDKYRHSDENSTKDYYIISFTDTVIICEQEHLPLIKNIFAINDKTTVFFLSNTKKIIQNLMCCEYKENDEEMALFKTEINNFVNKFKTTNRKSKCIIEIWNIIKTSIAGYLIKKSYLKSMNRINNFFKEKDTENEFYNKKITENEYIFLRNIGQGSSALVSLVYHIEKGELFAIKNFGAISNEIKNQNREIDNYESISHPLISKFHGIIDNNQSRDIVIEYINGIELQNCSNLQRNEKMKIIFEIMIIFEYLHNNNYVYRDLKPNNIMIDENKTAILVDFDRMIKYDDTLNNAISTTKDFFSVYCAPEIGEGKASYASDIYSIGMMIYFILTIELQNNKKSKFILDTVEFNNIPSEFSELKNLIKKCVNEKQEERPTISELIDEFYINFYSSIDSEGKYSHFIDNKIITTVENIHSQHFLKYWISLAEFQNPIAKDYRNSHNFLTTTIPVPIRESFVNKIPPNILHNNFSFFDKIPNDYQAMKDCIQNKFLQKIYSKFTFFYCNYLNAIQNKQDQNEFKDNLFDCLKEFKFITCQFKNSQSKTKIINVVICSESKCFIIENAYECHVVELINKIKESGSTVINVINISKEEINEKEIKEEINNFCFKFHHEIENNKFVSLTISSIACFLIRRYFYPTEYFNDQSFFILDKNIEKEKKIELINIIKSEKLEEVLFNLESLNKQIISDINQQNIVREFREEEFIILRTIAVDNQATYNLVFHLESQYIFMMKKINNKITEEIRHEIDSCQQCKNRVFVPFYGFLKENVKIIGFIYEFMSNSSFESFISSHNDIINPIYTLLTLTRIIEGIECINKTPLNYKLSNIHVDHDYNVYISNYTYDGASKKLFESEKGKSNEYPSDINLYCQIVNYLYDNKSNENSHQFNLNVLQKLKETKNVRNLYEYYMKNNQTNLSIYNYIKNIIVEEMKSFENFEQSLLNTKSSLNISNIVQFFFESAKMIQHENSTDIDLFLKKISIVIYLYLTKHENEKSFLFLFLAHLYNSDNKIIEKDLLRSKEYYEISANLNNKYALNFLGTLYLNGKGVNKDYIKAKKLFELSAKQNFSYAFNSLANIYRNGYGVKQDYSKAIEYYEKSAQLNNSNAFNILGSMNANGQGVKPNYLKAKEYYELSAKMNNPIALLNLGDLYERGHGVKKDYLKAKEYYEKSARLNNPNAPYHIGRLYFSGLGFKKDYSIAKEYFELAAKKDDPSALYLLGYIYENGLGVKQDYLKAKEYYELSAKQNNSYAILNLGKLYAEGKGVTRNYFKAKEYFELSAKFNNSYAFCHLGILYAEGIGVEQNYLKAKEYYELSAHLGNSNAINNLGSLYYYGNGVKQNYLKAKEYFELSGKLGCSQAYCSIGKLYENGLGVEQNYLKAKEYYELGAQSNNSDSLLNLGCLYFKGNGVNQNYMKAREYFELAAQFDNSIALCNLGKIYEFGKGVKTNYVKAKEYYQLSASLNNSDAIFNLGILYYNGKGVEQNYLKAKECFEKSTKFNNSKAFLNLGVMYTLGQGVKQDYLIAKEYFELSSSMNEPLAFYCLAVFYMLGLGVKKDYLISKKYLELSAKQNIPDALFCLGYFYDNGLCVEQSFLKAKKYYELAAKQNNLNAISCLGHLYEYGYGVKQDYQKAKKYYEQSAQCNNSIGLLYLGLLYLFGHGVKRDYSIAFKYIELSANLNHSSALNCLANFYLDGIYVKQDYLQAKKYYELAAKQNNSDALCSLGILYCEKVYFAKDYLRAKQYFEQSFTFGNSRAAYHLGRLYANGKGVEQNYLRAIEYFEKSGNLGFSDSFVNLGFLYFNGLGVKKNYMKAKKYFELAVKLNNPTALFNLGTIYLYGYGIEKNYSKAKEYFELSASLNFSAAQFKLGYYYSTGNVFDVDIEKSIFYYKKCLEQHYSTLNNDFEFTNYNEFYYHASNDLGLIYITVYKDKQSLELGFNYIKEAGLNEYPFGQNNLGLLYQFYIKNMENAKHMYERSLKNCFPLAAYNLGFMNEKEGNFEEAIKFYIQASEFENKPLIFHGKKYVDERLNVSIIFVICYTNLKLVEYFYSKKEIQKCREFFIKSLSKINYNSEFRFKLNIKNLKFSFSYLMAFIFNFQPFNLINQPNLNQRIKVEVQDLIKKHFYENEINKSKFDSESIKSTEKEEENKFPNKLNQKEFDSKLNDLSSLKSDNKFVSMKQENDFKIDSESLKATKEENENKFFDKFIQKELDSESNKISFKSENKVLSMEKENVKNEIEKIIVFNDVGEFFDFVMKDEKLTKEFIDEIRSIIETMQTIIYSPPFLILYGRISFEKPKIQDNISKFTKYIDKSFYDGFDGL